MSELIAVQAPGGVPRGILDDARDRVAEAAQGTGAGVAALRIRLTVPESGPARGQVNAQVDGRPVRVQETVVSGDLVHRLADGLCRRIGEVTGPWRPRPWQQQGHSGEFPSGAAEGGRSIVRVKRPALVRCSPDTAARTLDAMDYDIHLFTDAATGTDAVVYRVGPTGYRLARTVVAALPVRSAVPLTLSPYNAPRLSEESAVSRLVEADLPFLFFAHVDSGRGHVLYRRFDGRLGLIAGAL